MNDSTWCELTPFIPEMSHSNLVTQNANSLWKSVNWFSWNNWEVFIYLIFKRSKGFDLICMSKFLRINCFLVVDSTFLSQVLISYTQLDQSCFRLKIIMNSQLFSCSKLKSWCLYDHLLEKTFAFQHHLLNYKLIFLN